MKDYMNFSGHFKIECLDKNNNLIDSYQDKNMIMTSARTSMAEIFAKNTDVTNTSVAKLVLGTNGHILPNILIPKTSNEGFVNTRDRLFSSPFSTSSTPTAINDIIPSLNPGDTYYITTTVPANSGYYSYLGPYSANYTVLDANILDGTKWVSLGGTLPYVYNISFTLPGTSVDTVNGDPATNIVEDDVGSGSTVTVLQNGSSVTFNITIDRTAANKQDLSTNTSAFTEAALYANGRIFSLKTFQGKVKDSTVSIKLSWTITF